MGDRAWDPDPTEVAADEFFEERDDCDDRDPSGCRECGAALVDDLSDFVERLCFSCAHRACVAEPLPWGYRLQLLLFQVRTWPLRHRIRQAIAKSGLPF